MARKVKQEAFLSEAAKLFKRESSVLVDGFEISAGDIIKISGEYGVKFKFHSFVTNVKTGAQWIDCFEIFRGAASQYRSFSLDRVKRIPQRGKRAKRVV